MSWNNLIDSIRSNHYDQSYSIIANIIQKSELKNLIENIDNLSRLDSAIAIPIRDHIAFFLGFFPVYFSIDIPSYELLGNISNADGTNNAQIEFFDWFKRMISEKDTRVSQYNLDIELMSSSIYSVIFPEILSNRSDEIANCKIPFSTTSSGVNRYSILDLFHTGYGLQLLRALDIRHSAPVIGDSLWNDLSTSMLKLGFEPSQMLHEISPDYWSSYIKIHTESWNSKINQSKEVQQLREIRYAYHDLDSPDLAIRIRGLDVLARLNSRACDKRLFAIASNGVKSERLRAMQILVENKRVEVESILVEALKEQDPDIHAYAAKGISTLTSIEFTQASKDIFQEHVSSIQRIAEKAAISTKSSGISLLSAIAKSPNKLARIEALHALVSHLTSESEQILFDMMKDHEYVVRLELAKCTPKMRPDFARVLLNEMLNDESYLVRNTVIKIAENLWPHEY